MVRGAADGTMRERVRMGMDSRRGRVRLGADSSHVRECRCKRLGCKYRQMDMDRCDQDRESGAKRKL